MKLFAPAFAPSLALLRNALGLLTLSGSALVNAQTETLRIQDYPGLGNVMVRVAAANG